MIFPMNRKNWFEERKVAKIPFNLKGVKYIPIQISLSLSLSVPAIDEDSQHGRPPDSPSNLKNPPILTSPPTARIHVTISSRGRLSSLHLLLLSSNYRLILFLQLSCSHTYISPRNGILRGLCAKWILFPCSLRPLYQPVRCNYERAHRLGEGRGE